MLVAGCHWLLKFKVLHFFDLAGTYERGRQVSYNEKRAFVLSIKASRAGIEKSVFKEVQQLTGHKTEC